MTRLIRIAIGVLLAASAWTATVFVIVALGQPRAPSAAECVDDWNTRARQPQRDQIAAGEFQSAIVQGWLAKRDYPGCGIVFVSQTDQPWLSCVRTFSAAVARLTEWSCEGDPKLGAGRSSGFDVLPNAAVGADRKLMLIGTS